MIESTHPTPQFERQHWRSLSGLWRFAFDDDGQWLDPGHVNFDRLIEVPYPCESQRSGIGEAAFHKVVWYAIKVQLEEADRPPLHGRLLLHFGAVDYSARVWANGQLVAEHRSGHTPFVADLTNVLERDGWKSFEIALRAEDDPYDLAKPRGKQDWLPEPHAIWYPRTTGIWQDVWLEPVPETRIAELRWTPHLEHWEFGMDIRLIGPLREGLQLRVRLLDDNTTLADDRYAVLRADTSRRIAILDPGVDDFRDHTLWSPSHPHLIRVEIELLERQNDAETPIDRVLSYTAMRSVGISGNVFLLNNRPAYLRMVLDQGYWSDTLMAADDDMLRYDVELTKRLGFNGVRKHQKIENPRWLYWCDVLGLMVWEEMPSPYRFTPDAVERLVTEWTEAIRRDASHPCIVAWVPINESWGVPDLPNNPAHRDYVRSLYHLTRALDQTRPVIGNDGWENLATDIVGIHDYSDDLTHLIDRYGSSDSAIRAIERQRTGGRPIALDGFEVGPRPIILSEFGGISLSNTPGWGYSSAPNANALLERYERLMAAIWRCDGLAGFCYTQLTDTFQEENGLLNADRSPKIDIGRVFRATVRAPLLSQPRLED